MKKSLAMALAASVVLSAAGTVFAAEDSNDFKFNGSFTTQFRSDDRTNHHTNADVKATGLKSTLTINMEKPLTDNLSLYGRFTHQNFNNQTAQDYQADWIKEDYNTAIDAFGFKYNNAGVNYVIGSQALTIGATGLVYDNGFIGEHALPYAVKASSKVGATDLTAIYARTNYQHVNSDNEKMHNENFYVLQGQYAANEKTTLGAFFARANYEDMNAAVTKDSMNYYGLSAGYKLTDKLNFVGEYIKSTADDDNKGYIGGLSYAIDSKNTVGASYYRVEDQAAISDANLASMTTAPFSNAKGYILSYSYKYKENITLAASYDTQDKINDQANAGANNDRNRTRVGVTFTF